jgi:hypothetical protein
MRFGFLSGLFARRGGYAALAERFATTEPPPEPAFHGYSVMLDNTVAYKFCVTLAASAAGLYVHPQPRGLGDHPAVLIPWEQIGRVEKARLYWRPGVRLTIGEPRVASITLFADLWEQLAARAAPLQ